tara:strand:+ start:1084 stop:2178 length:1095 start_codon:yes stop_codon:yes gene_type:complete
MNKNIKKILISTGGTGGHVMPALSLNNTLSKSSYIIKLTTDKRGLKYLEKNSSLNVQVINSDTIFNKNLFKAFLSVFKIFFAFLKSVVVLLSFRPKLVFGMGGYSSFPVCLAAKLTKTPFIIYENNILLGKTNKVLLPFAKKLFTSFPKINGVEEKYKNKVIFIGNIIRDEILKYSHKIDYSKKDFKILILGGSQGAKIFGKILPQIFKKLRKENFSIKIFQQCLISQKSELSNFYINNNIEHEIFNFTQNILNYYKQVDLVISRSGSSALAELLNSNIPVITIPLPSAADNHQLLNAKFFQERGLCYLIEEQDIEEKLFLLIKSIYKDKSILDQMVTKQKKYSDLNVFNNIKKNLKEILNETN